ncbi:MAG: aldose 1-epimerase, partial [Spirochaetota bacterium]|nr:aldose 1-epimerase [Spirochaetota bacterium]
SVLTLSNPETNENLILSPSLGGTIVSLTLGADLHQILDNDKEEEFQKNPLFRGRFLFPFNDRIPGGKYSFQGKTYQLPINCSEDKSAIHGFIYNTEVTILEQTESAVSMFWRTGKDNFPGYPFDISLKTDIKLHNGGVLIYFTIKNEGDIPAPYALGWHSYFKTDSESTLKAEYPFYFDIDKYFLPVGNGLLSADSKFDFAQGAGFSEKFLDHTFKAPANGISILKNKHYSIKIEQNNFKYTQLFIPPDKKSIAIEPISSKPNSFNSNDVLILQTDEKYIESIRIDIIDKERRRIK